MSRLSVLLCFLALGVSVTQATVTLCLIYAQGSCVSNTMACPSGTVPHPDWACSSTENCCFPGTADVTTTGPPSTTDTTQTTTTTQATTTTPAAPPPPTCGMRSPTSRIYDGLPTNSICEWPWVVSIRGRITSGMLNLQTTRHICNGVLVQTGRVVTSASCVHLASLLSGGAAAKDNLMVVVGDYHTDNVEILNNIVRERFHTVQSTIIHPQNFRVNETLFESADIDAAERPNFNVAVLKLNEDVMLGDCREVICLPSAADVDEAFSSRSCMVATWGVFDNSNVASTVLRQGSVDLIWSQVCSLIDPTFSATPTGTTCGRVSNEGICVGDDGGMVACQNDNGVWKLRALVNDPRLFGDCENSGLNLLSFTDLTNPSVLTFINGNLAN